MELITSSDRYTSGWFNRIYLNLSTELKEKWSFVVELNNIDDKTVVEIYSGLSAGSHSHIEFKFSSAQPDVIVITKHIATENNAKQEIESIPLKEITPIHLAFMCEEFYKKYKEAV